MESQVRKEKQIMETNYLFVILLLWKREVTPGLHRPMAPIDSLKGNYWLPTCNWQDLFTFDMFWLGLSISSSCHHQKILHHTCLVNCGLAIYFSSMGFLFLKRRKSLKLPLFSASLNFFGCWPIVRSLEPFLITQAFSDFGKEGEKQRHSHGLSFCRTHGPGRFNGLRLLVGWGRFVGREQVQ